MTPEYKDAVLRAVSNELTDLQLRYDTRVLAVAMLQRSIYLLRALGTAGKWSPEEIQAIVMEATADLHDPLPQKPKEMVLRPGDPSREIK